MRSCFLYVSERFLKFLPGNFKYTKTGSNTFVLSVYGYIEIFYRGLSGTVRERGRYTGYITDNDARTICSQAGYAPPSDGWSNNHCRHRYDKCKQEDRSSLRCLISGLRCSGRKGEKLFQCGMDPIEELSAVRSSNSGANNSPHPTLSRWYHREDVAIKCDF